MLGAMIEVLHEVDGGLVIDDPDLIFFRIPQSKNL